jgi:TRAP-type C4-dicarboxylate transport system permease small subunit
MKGLKKILDRYSLFLHAVERGEVFLGILMVFTIVACIFSQVFSRYALGRPLVWVEELSTYCFIWGTFLGASIGLKQARHIRIRVISSLVPENIRRWLSLFVYLCIAVFCFVMIGQGIRAMGIESMQHTIALPIRLSRKYFYSWPLTLACASMLLTSVHYLAVEGIHQLTTGTRVPEDRGDDNQ